MSPYQERATVYDADDDDAPSRMPRSARRYPRQPSVCVVEEPVQNEPDTRPSGYSSTAVSIPRSPIPARSTARDLSTRQIHPQPVTRPERHTEEVYTQPLPQAGTTVLKRRQRRPLHGFVYVGAGMLLAVIVWVLCMQVTNWWQVTQDDWRYGRPRTYQVDAVVGHHDSINNPSHFIAVNLHGHIRVIEFPGGDASQAKVYIGPTIVGANQNLVVVTLSFKDVNRNHEPEMILNVGNNHFVYKNSHGQFEAEKP